MVWDMSPKNFPMPDASAQERSAAAQGLDDDVEPAGDTSTKPVAPTDRGSLLPRIMLVVSAVLALLSLTMIGFLNAFAGHAANSAYDQLLSASALSIADSVQVEDGNITVDLPYSSLSMLATSRRDRVFYKVVRSDGSLITGYENLPGQPVSRNEPTFGNARYLDSPIRLVRLGRLVGHTPTGEWVTIVVASTKEERDSLAKNILAYSILPLVIALFFGVGAAWFGIHGILAPLRVLATVIRGRGPNNFQPISVPIPTEVTPLVEAVNIMMARLEHNLEYSRTFIADAAHQIRTPLASLRVQAELAVDESDPERLRTLVGRIHRNAVDASELTTQLLNHAAIVHRSEAMQTEPVDLAEMVSEVVYRATVVAEDVEVGISCQSLAGPVMVEGDSVILREAIANLVDNAMKYAGADGPIEISIEPATASRGAVITVADHGPGISDVEKPSVMQRFIRGQDVGGTSGSGLGLAIVAVAADAHGAVLELDDTPGGGLTVHLTFPLPGRTVQERPRRRGGGGRKSWLGTLAFAGTALLSSIGLAQAPVLFEAPGQEHMVLHIASALDQRFMEPLILGFQTSNPDISVEYTDMLTTELYAKVLESAKQTVPDLVVSSAVDLQVKLVNDGYTKPYVSSATSALPDWANWRDEIFSIFEEPVVVVYNKTFLKDSEVPHSRQALIRLLSDQPDKFQNRVMTYNIATSGVGYLLATQDSVLSSQYWHLMAVFGERGLRLASRTSDILDAVETGDALIGYNTLGPYARERVSAGAPIGIVLSSDYTLVVPQTAIIPRAAHQPELAGRFIDYLLSQQAQAIVANTMGYHPTATSQFDMLAAYGGEQSGPSPIYRVALGPGLLVFLDSSKRSSFMKNWMRVIHPNQ